MHTLDVCYAEFTQKHLEPTAPLELIDKVRHELSKVNIKATAHGVNRFSADHAENRKLFQFAKRAGYRNLTASPSPVSFDSLENWSTNSTFALPSTTMAPDPNMTNWKM